MDDRPLTLGPRSVERPADAGFTLVAGLDGAMPSRVDGGGLVSAHGADWSVDWWIGADDRWHLPAREASVRQRRVGYGPVVETSLRVPSGDVIHTVYPLITGGRTITVVEIRNDSPVPVALAIAIRPYAVTGDVTAPSNLQLSLEGAGVTVNGRLGVVLPRPPNEAGSAVGSDLLADVGEGRPLEWPARTEGRAANAVCLYPLPHKTSLRFAIPSPSSDATVAVDRLTDAAASARGWTAIVERAARFEFPDPGITELAGAARARMLLEAERLAGRVLHEEPGAGLGLEALAAGGHQVECGWSLDALGRSFPTRLSTDALAAAQVVSGAAAAAELVGEPDRTEALLEPMAQLTHLIERAEGRGNRTQATATAKRGLATLAALAGQEDAAADLRAAAAGAPTIDLDSGLERLMSLAAEAAPVGRWNPNDSAGKAARYWLMARDLMIRPVRDGATAGGAPTAAGSPGTPSIDLLPEFPTAWRGGSVEVHRAPALGFRVSFAIRWHGYRPALLWDVEAPAGVIGVPSAVRLRCPALDPTWSTTEQKGEALLIGVAEELPEAPAPGDSFN